MEKWLNNCRDKRMKQMPRLKPINESPKNQDVFNVMDFTIFCPKHRKIAVSFSYDDPKQEIWFPFVYLSSDIKERLTVEESIALILSDGKPQLMAVYKKEQPYDANVSYVCSIKMKEFNFGFTRFVCLVRLHSDNPILQCCRKTSRIIWIDIERIFNNTNDCLWGRLIKYYARQIDEDFQRLRSDYFMISSPIIEKHLRVIEEETLKSLNITEKKDPIILHGFHSTVFSDIRYVLRVFQRIFRKIWFQNI